MHLLRKRNVDGYRRVHALSLLQPRDSYTPADGVRRGRTNRRDYSSGHRYKGGGLSGGSGGKRLILTTLYIEGARGAQNVQGFRGRKEPIRDPFRLFPFCAALSRSRPYPERAPFLSLNSPYIQGVIERNSPLYGPVPRQPGTSPGGTGRSRIASRTDDGGQITGTDRLPLAGAQGVGGPMWVWVRLPVQARIASLRGSGTAEAGASPSGTALSGARRATMVADVTAGI